MNAQLSQLAGKTVVVAALLVVCGCGPNLSAVSCPDAGTALTWDNFGANFMTGYCVLCHGGARVEKRVDLTTAAGARANAGAVISQAGTGTNMPQRGSATPTAAERQQLTEWVSCGAP